LTAFWCSELFQVFAFSMLSNWIKIKRCGLHPVPKTPS
jgi:hypothetical protein